MMRKLLRTILVAAFWLGLWQLGSLLIGQDLLLPSPLRVAAHLFRLGQTGGFWLSIGATLLRIVAGYALGCLLGCALGALTAKAPFARALLFPLLQVVRATPVSSFIILVILWIATDLVPVFITLLMVLGIFWQNIYDGLSTVDRELLEMARVFRFTRKQQLSHIYLPSLKPFFASAAATALGLAWKSGVAAEVLCHPDLALGSALYDAKIYLETPDLFAWTAMVVLLSMLLEKLIRKLLGGAVK